MILKITGLYILCRDIQVSTYKNQFSIEMISKMTEPCILWGDIQIPTEKVNSVSIDLRDHKTIHPLWRHSNSNWKRQFSINRFERSQNFTSFVGTFKSQLKKPDHYRNDYKDEITLHSLWGIQLPTEKDRSVLKWFQIRRNLTSFVGTFKFQLK